MVQCSRLPTVSSATCVHSIPVWIHRLIILYDQQNLTSCRLTYNIHLSCWVVGPLEEETNSFGQIEYWPYSCHKSTTLQLTAGHVNDTKRHRLTSQLTLLLNAVLCDGRQHRAHCYCNLCDGRQHRAHCYCNLLLSGVHMFHFKVQQFTFYFAHHMLRRCPKRFQSALQRCVTSNKRFQSALQRCVTSNKHTVHCMLKFCMFSALMVD